MNRKCVFKCNRFPSLSTCHTGDCNSPLQIQKPCQVMKPRRRLISTTQGEVRWCVIITPKSMSQSDFLHLSKRAYFLFPVSSSGSLQPRISGQCLMMQHGYCASAVEQKSQCRGFLGPRWPQTKTPTQPRQPRRCGHRGLFGAHREEPSRSQGRGAEMSCVSYEI